MSTDPTPPSTASGGGLSEATALWCCHVVGPDDVYAAPDLATAEVWVDQMNGLLSRRKLELADDVMCRAEVAPWPHDPASHPENLRQAVRMMTTPGVMRALAATSTDAAAGWADEREALAEFLTQEFDYESEPLVGAQWPQHKNDDGYRGDRAYVRLQPDDVQARARENAGRILTFISQARRRRMPALPSAGEAETGSGDAVREALAARIPVPPEARGQVAVIMALHGTPEQRAEAAVYLSAIADGLPEHFAARALAPPSAPLVVEAGGDGLRDVSDWLHQPEHTGYAGLPESVRKALLAWSAALTPPPPASVAQAEEAMDEACEWMDDFSKRLLDRNPKAREQLGIVIAAARASRVAGAERALRVDFSELGRPDVSGLARRAISAFDDLVAESGGVYGLHLNGDEAPWSDLMAGGRYEEWTSDMEALRAALALPSAAGTEGV